MSRLAEEKIETLKMQLRCATKKKLKYQRNVFSLRNMQRSLTEELSTLEPETDLNTQQIEEMRLKIFQTKYQKEMIGICQESEKCKIENLTVTLNNHKKGFEELFTQERELLNLQNERQRQKEEEKQEIERQKKAKIVEEDDQIGKEAAKIEAEIDEIERECAVIAKRNRAIMLTLRRKLVETEGTRRERMKQMGIESYCHKENK